MNKYRSQQKLTETDILNMEQYQEVANLHSDYRRTDIELWITCDYNFAKHLQVGDEFMLIHEDSNNLSPFIHGIELCIGDYVDNTVWVVTRKIYSADGLDVYFDKSDNDL